MSQSVTFQIILSTDGKHTVMATTDQKELTDQALTWATATYDELLKRYGRKCDQRPKVGGDANGATAPVCKVHQVPLVEVQGRHGLFWSCHERNEDGSFCAYKPNGILR